MPFCPKCGKRNAANAKFCNKCGASLVQTERTMTQGENKGYGIASLVFGILALLSCLVPVFVFGILAIILGELSGEGESYGTAGVTLGFFAIIINSIMLLIFIFVGFFILSI